ncbi:MAG: 30S ribosomal protein S20 [Acidobacteria bacterium]|nr:30S ribosomal protein S20 [Acidobacteriota bacterium]
MANIKSQIKRNLQNEKRRVRNKGVRSEMRSAANAATTAIEEGADDIAAKLDEAYRRIDKAMHKGVIHRNEASRRKSRLKSRENNAS